MLHEDYIDLIIREEMDRLLEDNEPQQQQPQQTQGSGYMNVGGMRLPVASKGNPEDAGKPGLFGRAKNWVQQKWQAGKDAINQSQVGAAINQGVNRMAEKYMQSLSTETQKDIIAELVQHECLDVNTATLLHQALFQGDTNVTYIAQAAQQQGQQQGQQQEQGQEQQGGASGPSFVNEPGEEGLSDEMVQNMEGKLSSDGSNPYANITVNLSE